MKSPVRGNPLTNQKKTKGETMAMGWLSVGIGKKGKAKPSHSVNISLREGKYVGQVPAKKIRKYRLMAICQWAEHNPNDFWRMRRINARKNGSTYREHVIAFLRSRSINATSLIKDWMVRSAKNAYHLAFDIRGP